MFDVDSVVTGVVDPAAIVVTRDDEALGWWVVEVGVSMVELESLGWVDVASPHAVDRTMMLPAATRRTAGRVRDFIGCAMTI